MYGIGKINFDCGRRIRLIMSGYWFYVIRFDDVNSESRS